MMCWNHLVVGIFSREERSTYEWLIGVVALTCGVKDVRPVLITNNPNDFEREVPKCSFGILFHSQSRGRLNIANVTDSLYDEELKYLANKYGRENVLVVVGSMEDTSDEKKAEILRQQALCNNARDLFLFSELKGNVAPFQGPRMRELESCIQGTAFRQLYKKSLIWLIFVLLVLFIVIIVVSVRTVSHPDHQSNLSPPINVTNVTFHPTSYVMTTPVSLSFTSQMISDTTGLLPNITNTGDATKLPQPPMERSPSRRARAAARIFTYTGGVGSSRSRGKRELLMKTFLLRALTARMALSSESMLHKGDRVHTAGQIRGAVRLARSVPLQRYNGRRP